MKSRICLLAIALTLAAAPAAVAQQAPGGAPPSGQGPGGGQNRRMAALLQGITLTDAQRAEIDTITARFQSRMPVVAEGQRPDSAQMAQRRMISMRRDSVIRAVLTAEQQTVWDRNLETMRANMPQRP